MSFYNNFVCLCVRNDISPSAAAIEMGFKKSNVTYWKNGRTPSDASLVKIANYFHVTVDELVGDALSGKKETLDPKIEGVSPTVQELFDFIDTATDAELNELLRYAQFLMSKR